MKKLLDSKFLHIVRAFLLIVVIISGAMSLYMAVNVYLYGYNDYYIRRNGDYTQTGYFRDLYARQVDNLLDYLAYMEAAPDSEVAVLEPGKYYKHYINNIMADDGDEPSSFLYYAYNVSKNQGIYNAAMYNKFMELFNTEGGRELTYNDFLMFYNKYYTNYKYLTIDIKQVGSTYFNDASPSIRDQYEAFIEQNKIKNYGFISIDEFEVYLREYGFTNIEEFEAYLQEHGFANIEEFGAYILEHDLLDIDVYGIYNDGSDGAGVQFHFTNPGVEYVMPTVLPTPDLAPPMTDGYYNVETVTPTPDLAPSMADRYSDVGLVEYKASPQIETNSNGLYYHDFYKANNLNDSYIIFTFYVEDVFGGGQFIALRNEFYTVRSLYHESFLNLWIALLVFVFALILYTPLIGHKKDNDGIHLTAMERIPLEPILIGVALITLVGIFTMNEYVYPTGRYGYFTYYNYPFYDYEQLSAFTFMVFVTMLMIVYVTVVRRIKAGIFFKGLLTFKIIRFLSRMAARAFKSVFKAVRTVLAFIFGKIGKFAKATRTAWRDFLLCRSTTLQIIIMLAIFGIYELICLIFTISMQDDRFYEMVVLGLLLMFVGFVALAYFLIRFGGDLNKMLNTTEELSDGNINSTIDPNAVIIPMKKLALQINNIGTGLTSAVEAKIRSERLKTELITNVSHDIKTPLTSIITYIDLLQKEKLGSEKAYNYLEVLKEKSWRLKTLIEDLVEASKASTGNINLMMEKINLNELIKQGIGEFEDRFVERHLEVVMDLPEEPVCILADGKSVYRIIDNLFSNVTKYAMEHTRVYVDVYTEGMESVFVIKNISAVRLNISALELMERFVRGDVSRNTEGNGLGLSIAGSLTELMDGVFDINIDGDLFKVTVSFLSYGEVAGAQSMPVIQLEL